MTASTRDAYVEKLKARLDRWNAELDTLEAKAREASADARVEREKHVARLKSQRDEAQQKLEKLARAADEGWEELQKGAEEAWASLNRSFDEARRKFESR